MSIRKDQEVHIRMTRNEYESLRHNCAQLGCTVADFIRCAVNAYCIVEQDTGEEPSIVTVDSYTMRKLAGDVSAQGTNINQIAHAANTAALILREARDGLGLTPDSGRTVLEACDEVADSMPGIMSGNAALLREVEAIARRRVVALPDPRGRRG